MRLTYIILPLLIIALASCRSGKLQKKGVDLGKESSSIIPPNFPLYGPTFLDLKLKSEVDLSSATLSQRIPVTFHVRKDSMIWASVSMGLELGRAKITKDSLVFLDRFNRRAYIGTWADLSQKAGFSLNYQLLEALLTGGMLFPVEPQDVLQEKPEGTILLQEREGVQLENKLDKTEHRVYHITALRPASESTLEVGYSRYIRESDQLIPSVVSMVLSGASTAKLQVVHSAIEVSEQKLSYSFSIPGNYRILPLPGL